MASRSNITAELVRQILNYDPETGVFTWRTRPSSMFATPVRAAMWNTRYAGKVAGSPMTVGYQQISVFKQVCLAHRLAWLHVHGEWPSEQVDHINGDRSDNRLANLRAASSAENHQNRISNRGISKYIGVSWNAQRRKWQAHIAVDGKSRYLGLFDSEEEAYAAYLEAKRELHPFSPVPREAA